MNDLDDLNDLDDCQADELNREYKEKIRGIIESFGGLENAKNQIQLTGDPLSNTLLTPLKGDPIPARELQEAITAYLLIGLDNSLGLSEQILQAWIEELENLESSYVFDENSVFSGVYSSFGVKLKSGVELTFDLGDLRHMLANEKAKKTLNSLES